MKRLLVIFILLVLVLSYGQTLFMYFWQDDSALIFKLQNPEGPAGSFGAGLWQRGAYQYLVVPFVPFFKLFGTEPFGYFLIGFVTYGLATLAFYYFAKKLTENKPLSFWATLIFASGYVGSDTMFRIINSWQTNIGLVLALLTFGKYVEFLKHGGKGRYWLSLTLFFLSIELAYIRSHSIIFPILIFDILLRLLPIARGKLIGLIFRQLPFWILFKIWYLQDENFGASGIGSILTEIFRGNLAILSPLFSNIGNAIIPDIFTSKLALLVPASFFTSFEKILWQQDQASILQAVIGLTLSVLTLIITIYTWKKNKSFAIVFFSSFIIIASQIFGYFSQYPTAVFPTAHRYFSHSFIGVAIFWASLSYYFFSKKKIVGVLLFSCVVIAYLSLGIKYQAKILVDRSIPSRKFYDNLLSFVPYAEKGSTFYFDVYEDPYYQKQFGDFFSVGSMPETTALAMYYNFDRYDTKMITLPDELFASVSNGETKVDKLYTFFYGKDGLVDTTSNTRKRLITKSSPESIPIDSVAPVLVDAQVEIKELQAPTVYPFVDVNAPKVNLDHEEKIDALNFQVYLKNLYKSAKVKSTSEWKFREIRNIFDNDDSTAWQGHRIWWHENKNEQVVIEMEKEESLSGVAWKNWHTTLSPTEYSIDTSLDGEKWTTVKNAANQTPKSNGELVVDSFSDTRARFVRMNITKTSTDDAPAILEIFTIPSRFQNVPLVDSFLVAKNPFSNVENKNQWEQLNSAFGQVAYLIATYKSDKYPLEKSIQIPAVMSNGRQDIEFLIQAGGTRLENVGLSLPYPAELVVHSIKAKSLTVDELEEKGLVKEFREN